MEYMGLHRTIGYRMARKEQLMNEKQ